MYFSIINITNILFVLFRSSTQQIIQKNPYLLVSFLKRFRTCGFSLQNIKKFILVDANMRAFAVFGIGFPEFRDSQKKKIIQRVFSIIVRVLLGKNDEKKLIYITSLQIIYIKKRTTLFFNNNPYCVEKLS